MSESSCSDPTHRFKSTIRGNKTNLISDAGLSEDYGSLSFHFSHQGLASLNLSAYIWPLDTLKGTFLHSRARTCVFACVRVGGGDILVS